MTRGTRDVMRGVALAALVCALAGCSESGEPGMDKGKPTDPVEVAAEELGAQIDGCADTGFASGTLTLTLAADPLVLSAPGGKINANGYICTGTVSGTNQQLSTTNVTKIAIAGSADPNKVILDMLPGSFGTRILSNAGGITVDFLTTDGGADSFMIRGGVGNETYKFAKNMSTSDVYVEISGDKVADINVKPGTGGISYTASMGLGADTIVGNPAAADITSFAGTSVTVVSMATAITAYGGVGDDRFTGGDGDDVFYGGANNDTFKMAATDDGSDTYIGDADTDTVDYSNRTADLTVDVGPEKVATVGTVDLATLDYAMDGALDGLTLIIEVDDDATDHTVTFVDPTDPADLVAQINTQVGSTVASITGKNRLMISTTTSTDTSAVEIKTSTSTAALGLTVAATTTVSGTTRVADADDGLAGEGDDVHFSVENITGGTANDLLIGSSAKNVIKGGLGNDEIMGGFNDSNCADSSVGDTLQGEAGDDVFYVPVYNCWASLSGGTGNNVANFSGRSVAVVLSNNGTANDGASNGDEKVNIATDILKLVGGFGGDTLTGGSGTDIFVGGPGADTMSGGVGTADMVDYSAYTVPTFATPCFTTAVASCPAGNDGAAAEGDQIHLVEHVIGGSDVDTYDATGVSVDMTFEGRNGADVFTGGDGNDTLWGDDGADDLNGGAGDDNINGGAGIDVIDGGNGDGDICITDGDDTPAAVGCEL